MFQHYETRYGDLNGVLATYELLCSEIKYRRRRDEEQETVYGTFAYIC